MVMSGIDSRRDNSIVPGFLQATVMLGSPLCESNLLSLVKEIVLFPVVVVIYLRNFTSIRCCDIFYVSATHAYVAAGITLPCRSMF